MDPIQRLPEQFGGDGPWTCEVELSAEGVATTQAGTRSLHPWSRYVAGAPSTSAALRPPNPKDVDRTRR